MAPALLYDGDCGFCRTCVAILLAWDRNRRLRPVEIQSAEGERLLADLTPAERLESWHIAADDDRASAGRAAGGTGSAGGRSGGGAAFPRLFRELPGGGPLAAFATRFPDASEHGYRWVAGHRGPLGRALPGAVRRWADRRIEERGKGAAGGGR